jgi:hypothetical protein
VAHISRIEKIARDICWGEFAEPAAQGCTKAAYWDLLSEEKKAEYIRDARRMCWWIKRVDRAIIEKLLADQAA